MTRAQQEELYTAYHDKVMGYIRTRVNHREDAEDLCAGVFERAFRAGDRYDEGRAAPGTWLYAITRNAVIDYYRTARPTEELPEDLAGEDEGEENLLREELLDALAGALEGLESELTDIVVLRYYDGLPLTEVALRLGMSYGAVKLRHQKALTLLRQALAEF